MALLTLGFVRAAVAADPSGNYAIWGAGARSCHQFESVVASPDEREPFRDFLMGYLTAYNTLAPDTYNAVGSLSLEQALSWLDDYCREHTIESFERAIAQLVIAHHERRLRVPPGANRGWGQAPSPSADADGR